MNSLAIPNERFEAETEGRLLIEIFRLPKSVHFIGASSCHLLHIFALGHLETFEFLSRKDEPEPSQCLRKSLTPTAPKFPFHF